MAINCPVDTPLLQELYNKVKSKVKDYQELKTLVGLWWERESQKDSEFDYEVYPTPQEIDALLKERVPQKAESTQPKRTISYTPKGKRTQVYTIEGTHIYNRDGKEVYIKDSVDRNKIFANLAVKAERAVVVEIDGERYVVNNRNQIISVQTGKIMQWADTDSKRKAILDAAQERFDDKATSAKGAMAYTLTSGDAKGADAAWTTAAYEFGIIDKRNYTAKSYTELSEQEKAEADSEYIKAAQALKKSLASKDTYSGKLVRRDWLQVKNADAVFAVSRILQPNAVGERGYVNTTGHEVVDGGTGYAVQMAINNNKPVHVFDQNRNQWFTWDGSKFVAEETPTLTRRFAGVGTRNLSEEGKAAIRSVFSKTFGRAVPMQAKSFNIAGNTEQYGVTVDTNLKANSDKWQKDNPTGIVAYRKYGDKPNTYTSEAVESGWIGNPFSTESRGAETVEQFYEWLVTGNNFGNDRATGEFRQAIINKILASPEGTPILYYKELGRPSHATVIGYLINHKEILSTSQPTASVVNTTPFSDEIEELTLEERGLGLAVDPNTLEAKADSAFGTPQRRRDAVNIIVNAIRSGFSYEYNQQRKNLQTRIANETDPDKAAELQEQLDSLTEDKAAATGIDNIIRRVRAMFNPANVTEARFPQNYEAIRSGFQRIDDNWETLLEEALDILKVTDSLDYYSDYTDIKSYKDNWMEKARFVDQRDSLSQKVRKILWTTPKVDRNGKPEYGFLGFPRYLQSDYVHSTLLQELGQARNAEHFWELLNNLAKRKRWVQPIIDKLNSDEEVKSQFYQNFRKEFMPYWIQVQKEVKNAAGEVTSVITQTKRVNKVPGISHMLDEWRDNYEEGSALDEYSIYSEGQQINLNNVDKAIAYLADLQNNYPDDVQEWLDSDENLNKVMRVLHMAGISAEPEVVRDTLKGEDLEDGTQRLDKVYQQLSYIFTGIKEGKLKQSVQNGVLVYDDLLNEFVIARIFDSIPEDSILSSFREMGKSYQSYSAPSYLGKLINNLKNIGGTAKSLAKFYQEQFGQYRWFAYKNSDRFGVSPDELEQVGPTRADMTYWRSSWLRQLFSSKSKRDLLERKIVMHSGKLEFNDWGNAEYARAMITEYYSTPDANSAWYYVPLLADAESAEFIKFTRYNNSSETDESGKPIPYEKLILRDLEDVVRQEYDRIMLVRQREGKVNPIANFDITRDDKGNEKGIIRDSEGNIISRNSGNEFKFFPALNTYKVNGRLFIDVLEEKIVRNDPDVSSFIQSALNDIMEQGFTDFMATMHEQGLDAAVKGTSSFFQVREADLMELFRNFYWNNTLAQSQIIQLTTTDLAYYKDMKDFQKRFKEIYAQTLKLNTEATFNGEKVGSPVGRALYLKDSIIEAPSKDALKEMLDGRVEAGELSEMDRDAILHHFDKVNVADAQAYRSLRSYRKILVMAGRWTDEMEEALHRLEAGNWTMADFNIIWQALKPFMYSQTGKPSKVEEWGDIKVPIQYKNSEFLLLAMYSTITGPISGSNKLKAINDFMVENDIDVVMFESAVKAGNQAPVDLSKVEDYDGVKNLLNSTIRNEDGSINREVVHEFDYEDYGIQVETPEHMIDKYQLFGTQIRKLITSDISDDARISIGGSKPLTKNEWWTMYNALITANVVDSYNEALEEFSTIEHVAEIIQRELKGNTRYSDEIKKACELIEVTNPLTGETEKQFNLPLYDPVQSERVQHLLNSIIKKKVTKQTIKGGTGIQVSAYGLTDKLKIVWEGKGKNRRMKYMECYLPAYSRQFFEPLMTYKTVNGQQVGELKINDLPPELRKIIGYRIPTEDKYSMAPLYIKGFLPPQNGSMIMLPAEITTLTGSDFDIDKFYLMFPEFRIKRFNYRQAREDYQRLNKMSDNVAAWFKNSELSDLFEEYPQEFRDWFEEHKEEYRLEKPEVEYIKYDFTKSARENTVQQRNNQLINMIWGVLTNPDTVSKQLNPGNFDKAKVAARICSIAMNANPSELMKILGVDKIDKCWDKLKKMSLDDLNAIADRFIGVFNPLSPLTQMFFHDQNATGGKMIGIYANNNANHAMAQHTTLECIPFTLNGVTYSSLHNIKNAAGNYITRNISNFLAASVDNVKDPVLRDLMQNTITGDVTCFLLRAGVEPNEVGLLMNQPIVKDIIKALKENEFKDRKTVIEGVINQWAAKRSWKTSPEDAKRYRNLYTKDLFNAILFEKEMQGTFDENASKGQKGWFNFQLYVGNAFKDMYETSNDLAELTAIMRADTSNGSAGPGISDTYQKINRIERFYARQRSGQSRLLNADLIDFHSPKEGEDIYEGCMSSMLPFLNAFTIAGFGGTMQMMSKYFPFFNSSIYNMIYNKENGIVTFAREGRTNAKLVNAIINDLMVYVMSKTRFFGSYTDKEGRIHTGYENRSMFIKNFPKEFQKILRDNPEIANNRFISRLRVKYPKRGSKKDAPIPTIVFRNSGKLSTIQRDMYSRDWLSLLYSDNPAAVELGLNLFKYASFMGGFGFGPNSFIHMAPVLLRKAVPGYEQTLRDLMKRDDYTPFIRQFILNHMDMQSLVPQLAGSDLNALTFGNGGTTFETPSTNSLFKRGTSSIEGTDGNLVMTNKLVPFISVLDKDGKVTYYEADSWEVADDQSFSYHKIAPLGFKGKVLEYEYGASSISSVFFDKQRFQEDSSDYTPFEDGNEGLEVKEEVPYDSSQDTKVPAPEDGSFSTPKDISQYTPVAEEDANGQISCGFEMDDTIDSVL